MIKHYCPPSIFYIMLAIIFVCVLCFYIYIYISIILLKKRKSHFDPFLEQGQGCCCPLGAPGAAPEQVKFQKRWWPRNERSQMLCVGISADVH